MSNEIDRFRLGTLAALSKIPSFQSTWPFLRGRIMELLGPSPTGADIFKLGDHLSEIFRSVPPKSARGATGAWDRTQSSVSAGGVVWECLVVWYLNFVAFGTPILATKRTNSNTPSVLMDAICVTQKNSESTSESDVVLFTVPALAVVPGTPLTLDHINTSIASRTVDCRMAIVQCKTNWNDNSQIPMLWDLLYRSLPKSDLPGVEIGRSGISPAGFKGGEIRYAFVTVPTNGADRGPGGVAISRVSGLSGGNYWGKRSLKGVARGFSEFLPTNFKSEFGGNVPNHVDAQLLIDRTYVDRFLSLTFVDGKSQPVRRAKSGAVRT